MDPRVAALLARCGRWARLSVLASALVACAAEPQPPAGPPLGVRVAPLSLSGLVDASYALTVRNSANEVVWTRAGLRSTAYGDGSGSLSYVGTCDAAASPNSVEVVVEGLYDAGGLVPAATWMNPTPVSLSVPCLADQDNAVDFDLTVVRAAQQGFFDVSVEFDDLFCSAKLDCQKGPGQPLELLFDPATGRRGQTAVVAFACTAGAGQETTLYLDDVVVTCPGPTVYTVDPSGGPGNITAAPPALFAAAVYRGAELFAGFEKTYWNTALGLNVAALGPNCRLTTTATASEEPFPNLTTPAVAAWPVIRWDVALTNASGALACTTHPVNGGNGVATGYVPGGGEPTHTFAHAASHAGDILNLTPLVGGLSPTLGTTGDSVTVSGQGFGAATGSVTLGGVTATVTAWTSTSVTFTVPPGAGSGQVNVVLPGGATLPGPWFTHTGITPATPAQLASAAYSVWDLDFDAVGNTYYAEFISGQDSIRRVAPNGTVTIFGGESDWNLGFVASTPDASVVIGSYSGHTPRSIGVVNASNHIAPVYSVSTACSTVEVYSGYVICGPADPEWGFDGYFYFGNGFAHGDVSRVSATSAPTLVTTAPLPAYVTSVATLPTGELWAAAGTGVYAINRVTGGTTLVADLGATVRSIASSYYHQRLYAEVVGGSIYELNPVTGATTLRFTGQAGFGFLTVGPDFKLYRVEGRVNASSPISVFAL